MSQPQDLRTRVTLLVEELAEGFVMADLSDADFLHSAAAGLLQLADELDLVFPDSAAAAGTSARVLKDAASRGEAPAEAEAAFVEQVLSLLQKLAARDLDEEGLDYPAGPAAGTDASPAEEDVAEVAGVDKDIMDEYIAHQESVVADMEDLILTYESAPEPQLMVQLKRLLHTAKGEAGVLGLNRVAGMLHGVEDYIAQAGEALQIDLLLEFKDWFEQVVDALRKGAALPDGRSLEGALRAGADSQPAPPAAAAEPAAAPAAASAPPAPAGEAEPPPAGEVDPEIAPHLAPVEIEDPEITAEFISEINEHFEVSDENLITLESDPANEEAIASIFRAFHTIKGTTSFMGLMAVSKLAHKAESLLDEVRKGRLGFEGGVVDATFAALDLLKRMFKDLEAALNSGGPFTPDPELPHVFTWLKQATEGGGAPAAPPPLKVPAAAPEAPPRAAREEGEPARPGDAPAREGAGGTKVRQTMKIEAERIDLLLEIIGELVIVESIVSQEVAAYRGQSRELESNLSQLTKITRSLQDMGMSMRLIPIDNTFRKMSRLLRDLTKKTGKQINLQMEGKDTELDKGMVEKLGDPLVHMIRNSVDHGIEMPEERAAAGKDPTGTIVLRAYHQGGNIHIEIRDDGRGLDREAIAAKAIERGLATTTDNLSDEEVYGFIFQSGFSTAKQVSDVSGRGVGMDVVKTNILGMRGNIRIASEKGQGTTFTLVQPLTMAIIEGMIVRVGSERYILPLLSIVESFQPTREMITSVYGKGEMVPFRGGLLPLFRLGEVFSIGDAETDPVKAIAVVIEDSGRQLALLVDELLGENQTVIKSLGRGLGKVEGIAGASIMPDGYPGLIIDVAGLFKLAAA